MRRVLLALLLLAGCKAAPAPARPPAPPKPIAAPVVVEKRIIVVTPERRLNRRALKRAADRLRQQIEILRRQVDALRDGVHHRHDVR
ncbi:MAG TPA: hypothetical protein VE993_10160 [Stellaceae bacterium]|nr:hypothetical protein [Stellaceae bacterium]